MKQVTRRGFVGGAVTAGAFAVGGIRRSAVAAQWSKKISVSTYPLTLHSVPYVVASSEGLWAKNDWDITEIISSGSGGASVRTIATGGIPIGEVAAAGAFGAWLVGAPIRIVSLGVTRPTEIVYIVKRGVKLSSPKELAGKKLGYSGPGSASHAAAALALEQLGLVGKVELVPVGGVREGLALLDRGEVDVAHTLAGMVKANDKFDIAFRIHDVVPKYAYTAIIAEEAFVQKEPKAVQAFLKARAEGVNRTIANPEAAANAWFKVSKGAELDSLRSAIKTQNDAKGWMAIGYDLEAVNLTLRSMELVGAIPTAKGLPLTEMLDQTFVDPDKRIKI